MFLFLTFVENKRKTTPFQKFFHFWKSVATSKKRIVNYF